MRRWRTERIRAALRLIFLSPAEARYRRAILRAGLFDAAFYRGAHPGLHPLCHRMPLRHFIRRGEGMGFRPNPGFCPESYLRRNPDVAAAGLAPFRHYLTRGRDEGRCGAAAAPDPLPPCPAPRLIFDPARPRADFAIHAHVYYPDLWPGFAARLARLDIGFDLYVTLTWRGAESATLAARIRAAFPGAQVTCLPNRGRDILPFVTLLNAGAFDGYRAVAKIHTKKSPHRSDGDRWRDHLIDGILPEQGLSRRLSAFLADPDAGLWVADGQHYRGAQWWGTNRAATDALLARVELVAADPSFAAGSIYWLKPLTLGMIRALRLRAEAFEDETGQVDGTLAHAVERAIGRLVQAAGQEIRETGALGSAPARPRPAKPAFVSAFYLPQFHPVPENDRWWGSGYTEWRAVERAVSMYPGHLQPFRPGALGHYDLRATEVMGDQARLARAAGIDAFCVYHYWFDPDRLLAAPLDRLLARREVDFPFYLCWANESWRRNWDGLSGEVLMDQPYADGFETRLVASTLPYMRDPRYARPDGRRPRFVIYRPGEMPDPARAVARMRRGWAAAGQDVELGAVHFHLEDEGARLPPGLFDFHVEMPPHGLVRPGDYLFGGPGGDRMGTRRPAPGFGGLIYDYTAVAARAVSPAHARRLPPRTIAGIMPGWDNTARRGPRGHIAHGANPATFRAWLHALCRARLATSYRGELFVNAWNEWAEKAVLEPSEPFGTLTLDVLGEVCAPPHAPVPARQETRACPG